MPRGSSARLYAKLHARPARPTRSSPAGPPGATARYRTHTETVSSDACEDRERSARRPRAPGGGGPGGTRTKEGRTLTGSTPERPKRGRPSRLSREHIVTAAYEIIVKEGAENLTMRRLAGALGSTAMAVYHHVRDKDELLTLTLEHAARTLPRPELPEEPRERLAAVCGLMHQAFVSNPWVVPIVARGEPAGMPAVWMTEEIVAALVGCGLSRERAVEAHRTIWYYTTGQILATVPRPGGPPPEDRIAADGERPAGAEGRHGYLRGVRHILDGVLPAPGSH
ncbi:TetR/AcrR family transcriptional regulator [Streptomyces sp. NPDC051162]|uniref:TetR/AcrR family transcriptional regulator n=1 Tax=unclassified Streptomyces TaxID=2593676 RepID=UPI003447499D